MTAKRKSCVLAAAALLVSAGPSVVVEGNNKNHNAFFGNAGRRSTWTLNLQLSSTPEGTGGEYRQGRPNIHGHHRPATSRRSAANIELARRTIEELRGGGGGRYDGYDDGGYYGGYGDDNNGDGDGGYYYDDNSQQGSSPNNRGSDDYYSRGKGSYYDDDDRYREDDYGYSSYNDGDRSPSSHSRKGRSRSPGGNGGSGGPASFIPKVIRGGNKKYGMYCLLGGSCLTGMGMVLFFNKALIRIGNLLFVSGVPLFIGPAKTIKFFMNPEKFRATGCVLTGLFLVFVGWPIFGILLEVFGLCNLFGNMFPFVKMMLRTVPGLNSFMGSGGKGRPKKNNRRNYDDYNDDYPYYDGQDDGGDGYGYGGGGGGDGDAGYY